MGGRVTQYIVRQGDYMARLAFVNGFDAEEVWNDPKNEDLKKIRPDLDVLAPGDILYIPVKEDDGSAITKGTENTYSAEVPKVELKLQFRSSDNRLANAKFTVEGDAAPSDGSTDGDGKVELTVSVLAQQIRVLFPDLAKDFTVFIGHMDPVTELSGVKARLTHLGYFLPPSEDDESDHDWLAFAIRDFQLAQDLPATGVMDDATRAALVAAHGS